MRNSHRKYRNIDLKKHEPKYEDTNTEEDTCLGRTQIRQKNSSENRSGDDRTCILNTHTTRQTRIHFQSHHS